MNIQEAVKILKEHNVWRRGNTDGPMASPTIIGIAIDTITQFHESPTPSAEEITVRKFMTNKYPTNQFFQCPVPEEYWPDIQEYAEQFAASRSYPAGWTSEEVLKLLKSRATNYKDEKSIQRSYIPDSDYEYIADKICAPSSGGWVRVEDGLPENNVWVLAAIAGKGILTGLACYCKDCESGTGKTSGWLTSDSPHPEKRITHWQPLPAPPQSLPM